MSRIKRTKHEQLEDAFADLTLAEQSVMLDRLASLNRWCTRERGKKTEPKAEAKGGQESLPPKDGGE